jgi:hypothetical protein
MARNVPCMYLYAADVVGSIYVIPPFTPFLLCCKFFFVERPNLFAICNNTFSKWWEG